MMLTLKTSWRCHDRWWSNFPDTRAFGRKIFATESMETKIKHKRREAKWDVI
jgi:hypothetical protein